MRNTDELNKNLKYTVVVFLIFVIRTIVLGFAMFRGPYFEMKGVYSFKRFSVILDITSIFQFIFMFDVIQTKNIFQLLLYIPILMYSLVFSLMMISVSHKICIAYESRNLQMATAFLYSYAGILVSEIIIHIIMYNRLKSDFKWFNFKRIGVNPIINEALKRREQFSAVKRFSAMVFCGEFVNYYFTLRIFGFHLFALVILFIILIVINIFPNEEHVWLRKAFLALVVACTVIGVGYSVLDFSITEEPKVGLLLETILYAFTMTLIFIGAYRDYQMFGSGLKEHYCGECRTGMQGKLSMVRRNPQ